MKAQWERWEQISERMGPKGVKKVRRACSGRSSSTPVMKREVMFGSRGGRMSCAVGGNCAVPGNALPPPLPPLRPRVMPPRDATLLSCVRMGPGAADIFLWVPSSDPGAPSGFPSCSLASNRLCFL